MFANPMATRGGKKETNKSVGGAKRQGSRKGGSPPPDIKCLENTLPGAKLNL